jgi:hypothetical protein
MLKLSEGFNLRELKSLDGRKVVLINRASNKHDGAISILRYRKRSEVPNIIIECEFKKDKFALQFENKDSDEIMDLYTMFCSLLEDFKDADAATSQDITEFFTEFKLELNSPTKGKDSKEDNPEQARWFSNATEISEEELRELLMKADAWEEDEENHRMEMSEDERFTADFFDFCSKGKLNFFKLLQMIDYLNLIKDSTPNQLNRFNYLAYISLCFKYDELRGSRSNPTPSVKVFQSFYDLSKRILGQAIGDYSIVQAIQSAMETLDGYSVRKWTKDDIDHINELHEGLQNQAEGGNLGIRFDGNESDDRDEFTIWINENGLAHLVAELFGFYSGTLYTSDLEYFILLNPEEYSVEIFIQEITKNPNHYKSQLKRIN